MQQENRSSNSEIKLVKSGLLRVALLTIGTVSFAVGVVGLFLPILPTTPFILITLFCYARSSQKFYTLLINNRLFGPALRQWQKDKSIPVKAKIIAISMIVVSVGCSIIFWIPLLMVNGLLFLVACAVIVYLIKAPTSYN